MKKFWRSGMINKKVVAKREQEEYINIFLLVKKEYSDAL